MKKQNVIITLVIILSLICMIPSLVTRISFEQSHNGYVAALVLKGDMTYDNLKDYKFKGITTLVADEADGGFDAERIAICREMGFDVALRARVGDEKSDSYTSELDCIVKENNIKYLIIKQNKEERAFSAPLEKVIDENKLTVVVSENMSQLSNEMPKGYESYIAAADGRLMRCYETLKNPLRTLKSGAESQNAGELLYHHMINSARDRNTEFIAINQIDDGSGDVDAAIEQTSYAAAKFEKWIQDLGYIRHKDVTLAGYTTHRRTASAGAAMLGVMMVLIGAELVFKKRNAKAEYAAIVLALGVFGVTFIIPRSLLMLYPSLFAPVAACFAFTVTICTVSKAKEKCTLTTTAGAAFAMALLTLAVGAAGLGALLSGTDYYLNDAIFRGVKLTLVLPVAYASAAMWIYQDCKIDLSVKGFKSGIKKIKPLHIIIVAAAIIAAGVYVMRSGNAKISPLENQIRNFIAEVSGARPRTKEFLIGWPMLAVAAVCIKCKVPKLLKWITATLSSILFASVTNTFCHVFTDFSVSALRTLNGIIFSIPFVAIVLILGYVFSKATPEKINKQ